MSAAPSAAYMARLERGLAPDPDAPRPKKKIASKQMARRRLEDLVHVVEINLGKLSDPDLFLPLDLLDRLERACHNAHIVNQLKVSQLGQWALLTPDKESAEDEGTE